jgi:hypothetical protein
MLGLSEGIDKVHSSPCENGPLTSVDCSCSGGAPYGDVFYECEGRIWGHKPLSGLRVRHLKIQRRLVRNLEFRGNAVCHSACWSLPRINYLNFNDERTAAVVRNNLGGLNTKIGPQLPLGGLARKTNAFLSSEVLLEGYGPHLSNLLLASSPQFVSRPPQQAGESDEKEVEQNKQPFGGMLTKSIVPIVFLGSALFLAIGLWTRSRMALLAIFGVGYR